MKKRVADYIADLLVENQINNIFSVVGGGAMHLNDAFGNHEGLKVMYNQHEQASTIAAEGYARVNNRMAAVCVTTGPGGTNTITGILCAWQDSIPMLVISGQVRMATMVESTGLNLRQFGEQEHYIVRTVKDITKYAVTVKDPHNIRYEVEKAIYIATHGRRGPCWLDIPLDVQSAMIETDELRGYQLEEVENRTINVDEIKAAMESATRPVIIAGSGIRSGNVYKEFREFVERMQIPVVAATVITDLMPTAEQYYYGNFGTFGGRTGNFIVQNADCLLVLGCSMSFKHIGFNYTEFSKNSKKIVVNVDEDELKKPIMKIDIPVCADLKDFFTVFEKKKIEFKMMDEKWKFYCDTLREKFPWYLPKHQQSDKINPYFFAKQFKEMLPQDSIVVVGNNCAGVSVLQSGIRCEGQRMWDNSNCGTMGYDLPASIGAAVASEKEIYLVTGDGGIQMNIQELQTVVYNKLPIKICIFSNGGYHSIEQTHTNFFGRLSGCNRETGMDLPSFKRLANAYEIPYYFCDNHKELKGILNKVKNEKGYCIFEVAEGTDHPIEPKIKSKFVDGQMVSTPIDDMYPFLTEGEYKKYAEYDKF